MLRPPGARFTVEQSQEQATLPGRQLAQFGDNMQQAGSTVARVYLEEVEQANQVRVNDAVNQLAKTRLELTFNPNGGFVNLRGENALKRPGDQPRNVEYG